MIKVLVLNGDTGAVSFYRYSQPYTYLAKHRYIDTPIDIKTVSPSYYSFFDCVVAIRPFSKGDYEILQNCKDRGLKIIIDFDDDLTAIPTHNPAFWNYTNFLYYNDILDLADYVTVSTLTLANKLPKSVLVPNILDIGRPRLNEDGITLWRGTYTHHNDLYVHRKDLERIPNVHYWGLAPFYLQSYILQKPVPIEMYFSTLKNLSPSLLIAPLENNEFNRSKSNIVILEATLAGAICVTNLLNLEKPFWDYYQKYLACEDKNQLFEEQVDYCQSFSFRALSNLVQIFKSF